MDFDEGEWEFIDASDACEVLVRNGITHVYSVGDSFMRHVHVALALTLTGDYERGALPRDYVFGCEGELQFESLPCRKVLAFDLGVCGDKVRLWYEPTTNGGPQREWLESPHALVLWYVGTHPLNATSVKTDPVEVKRAMDPEYLASVVFPKHCLGGKPKARLFWLTPHAMLDRGRVPERNIVRFYTSTVRSARAVCQATRVLDMTSFTLALTRNEQVMGARNMTYDDFHWGRGVNLVKAQVVLREVASGYW